MSRRFPELPGVSSVAEAGVRAGAAPAVAAAVRHRGSLVHLGFAGAAELVPSRRELGPDDLFDVASLTKVMATSTLAALLVQEGRLELDLPAAAHLPGFEAAGKERVTVRELLAHASGLPDWRPYCDEVRLDPVSAPAFLPPASRPGDLGGAFARGRALVEGAVLREPLLAVPGARAVYGDPAFIALGLLLEKVSGARLDRLFASRVASPLGLADTFFLDLARRGEGTESRRRFAATERSERRGEVICGAVNDDNAYAMGGIAGHAGLFSSAGDVAALGQAWLDALSGRPGILDPAVAREFARRDATPASTRALGWDTPTEGTSTIGSLLGRGASGAIGHLGYTGCSLWVDRDRELVCALLTNHVHPAGRRPAEILGLRRSFHDAVAGAILR